MDSIYDMLQKNIIPAYVDLEGSQSWEAQRCLDELHERDRKIERMQKHIDRLTNFNNQLCNANRVLKGGNQ